MLCQLGIEVVALSADALLLALGAAFISIAAFIIWMQRKAASCELHNQRVGYAAITLSILSSVAGVSLIVAAIII
jgi:uncharacterized iron-regulated membrane protein